MKSTSWGKVADWYDRYLREDQDSYQEQVILPNLSRLVAPRPEEMILDLACGTGFFARAWAAAGARVTGLDISPELVALAKKETAPELGVRYLIGPAHKLGSLTDNSFDKVTIVLALQNIAEIKETFAEVARVLKPQGSFYLVLNHPAFRIPKNSSWGWDEEGKQYRRVDRYLSEVRAEILMHPGAAKSPSTLSFHRPLQNYFKLLGNAGFAVKRLEEWISHRESQPGPRAQAENEARKEFPLFLFLEAVILKS